MFVCLDICEAASGGDLKALRAAIKRGEDVNCKDEVSCVVA